MKTAAFRLMLALAVIFACASAEAGSLYRIDQSQGTIGFAVTTFGAFDTKGHFTRFNADFDLDFARPERSRVNVTIEAAAIAMDYRQAIDMLLSPAYFDVREHPRITFASTSVEPVSPGHFRVRGDLGMRGVTHQETLDAVLTSQSVDSKTGNEISDFSVSGEVDRTAYGMVADGGIVSRIVHLDIRVRLLIEAAARAG